MTQGAAEASTDAATARSTEGTVVDCDVHTSLDPPAIVERLPPRYRDRGLTLPSPGYTHPHGRRIDREDVDWREEGGLETLRSLHLDEYGIDYGIVTGSTALLALSSHPNRDYALELARAGTEWIEEDWLDRDDRLRGSIIVAPQHPDRSADLIREYGDDPRFVQVLMGSASATSYGYQQYWPIYEAAVEMGLPVAIHVSAISSGTAPPSSASGHPTTYFESHNTIPAHFMGHVNSMILEGVFEEFPDLTFVCVEGGFGWVPHLMWRMDKNWKGLREQTPWLDRPPSEYLREHVRFTTQPIEEPPTPTQLVQVFEMMHAEETLMFSSDFPHWDGDDPNHALPAETPESMERAIMHGTANEVYDLEDTG